MKTYMDDPRQAISRASRTISKLIYGWDNASWCAVDDFLLECLAESMSCDGPILECGSGLSTILLGVIAEQTGKTVWSLEHNAEWGNRVQKCLCDFGIESVHLCVSPLKDYGDFSWYAPPIDVMPNDFSLVICDGPPARTRGGRYGLVPVMKGMFGRNCTILLDDAVREDEKELAARCEQELGAKAIVCGSKKAFFRISIGE